MGKLAREIATGKTEMQRRLEARRSEVSKTWLSFQWQELSEWGFRNNFKRGITPHG